MTRRRLVVLLAALMGGCLGGGLSVGLDAVWRQDRGSRPAPRSQRCEVLPSRQLAILCEAASR